MDPQATTKTIPSRLTLQSETSYGLWRVEMGVQRTTYCHHWSGDAADSAHAKTQALDSARRAWPGFSFVVRSVVQVA